MENNNGPFNNLEHILSSVAHALVVKGKEKDADILSKAHISIECTDRDNWDGGTDIWSLYIKIAYPDYLSYTEEKKNDLESFINETVKPFLPETGDWVQAKIIPKELKDRNWRNNVAKGNSKRAKGGAEGFQDKNVDSKLWLPNHFRLFLSHCSSFKKKTADLQKSLKQYGISGFVAHEDIEPAKEWQEEIEKALHSMDALGAILTPKFNESQWTDQEVGVAIGRDVLIIPIRKGINPYGLIGKYQGMQAEEKNISEVSKEIFRIISNHSKTKEKITSILVDQLLLAHSENEAIKKLDLIKEMDSLSSSHLERIRDKCLDNKIIINSKKFINLLNQMLKTYNISPVSKGNINKTSELTDEIPF